LSRCEFRMITTNNPRQWCLLLFYLYIPTYWTRTLLWFIYIYRNMISRCNYYTSNYRNSLSWLCFTLRTNILLRSYCNHKSTLCHSIPRNNHCSMTMRRFRGRQCNSHTIFHPSLFTTICCPCTSNNSFNFSTPNRIK